MKRSGCLACIDHRARGFASAGYPQSGRTNRSERTLWTKSTRTVTCQSDPNKASAMIVAGSARMEVVKETSFDTVAGMPCSLLNK